MFSFPKKCVEYVLRKRGYEMTQLSQADPFVSQKNILGTTKDMTIFDVGANTGATVLRYRKFFPNAIIHAFEPEPRCAKTLEENVGQDSKVIIVKEAVSETTGTLPFYISSGKTTHSLLERPSNDNGTYFGAEKAAVKEKVNVSVTTIDTYVQKHSFDHIDILKIDVEGAERQVLRGAQNLLSSGELPIVFLEMMFVEHFEGQALFHELTEMLVTHGYSLFDLFDLRRSRKNGQLRWGNALFISQSLRSQVDNTSLS